MHIDFQTLFDSEKERISASLHDRVRILQDRLSDDIPELPITVSIKIDDIDPIRWLSAQNASPRVYWSARDGGLELAGCGSAILIDSNSTGSVDATCRRIDNILALCDDKTARFIGGRCFDEKAKRDDLWSDFHNAWFVIPRVAILSENGATYLVLASVVSRETTDDHLMFEFETAIANINNTTSSDQHLELLRREDLPDSSAWSYRVGNILGMIECSEISKAVLARRSDLICSAEIDPVEYLSELISANDKCYAFMIEPTRGSAFLGVSPERLFKIDDDLLLGEAVSGTVPRGESEYEDRENARWLLSSEKNRHEHSLVEMDLFKMFENLCRSSAGLSERSLLELNNVSHLYSRVEGRLRAGIETSDIIRTLHPTPAVGGSPRDLAMQTIRNLEPFSRGWYAAPVGVFGKNSSDVTVAIRSALVSGNTVSIFAGAGIVAGSEPTSEWQELEHKISLALRMFDGVLV
jgi:menaquinone-specific isochorismate synthase